ncbi:MAG: hypothetical protein ACR2QF_02670, partial [Geminicoccaceae bacterium]
MAISVLNAFADTGALVETSPGSFTVSAGTDRLLAYNLHMTGSTDTISVVTYGGQPMTEQESAVSGGGFPARVRIFTLDEAGIAAATGTGFGITGDVNGTFRATAVALEGVDQTTPVVDSGSGIASGGDIADVVLTTVADGYAFAAAMVDHDTDVDQITWGSDLTERVEVRTSPTGNTLGAADT